MRSGRHRKLTVFVKPSSAKCKRPLTAPVSRTLEGRWTRYKIVNGTLESPQLTGNRQGDRLQLMGLRSLQIPRRLNTGEGEAEEVVEEVHREVVGVGAGAEHHLRLELRAWPTILRLPRAPYLAMLPPPRL
jgi:hypothetical protein